jgi:hypothetical protein
VNPQQLLALALDPSLILDAQGLAPTLAPEVCS